MTANSEGTMIPNDREPIGSYDYESYSDENDVNHRHLGEVNEGMASPINREDETLVSFSNLEFTVKDIDKSPKVILKRLTGQYRSGELVALMGPSGAGKTSLMNILCGQNWNYSGNFTMNGVPWQKELRNEVGFAPQFDLFFPNQTVFDTMMFRAAVKLPGRYTYNMRKERVEHILKDLRLSHTVNLKIGDYRKTLSGGELKRVAVGLELITSPRVLILDEPTSGLDSTSAYELIDTLKRIAEDQQIVMLISLHQPSAKLFRRFDRATFMRDGVIVYHGETGRALENYCTALGEPCPDGVAITDHLMNMLSNPTYLADMLSLYNRSLRYSEDGFYLDLEAEESYDWPLKYPCPSRIAPYGTRDGDDYGVIFKKKADMQPNKPQLLKALFWRSLKSEALRCWQFADAIDLGVQIIIQSCIYWQTYSDRITTDFYSHVGQIYGLTISVTFNGLFKNIFGELGVRGPVRREVIARHYNHWEYKILHTIASTIVYIPWPTIIFAVIAAIDGVPVSNGAFLGAWVGLLSGMLIGAALGSLLGALLPSFPLMSNWGVAIQLTLFMVSGNYTTPESIPSWLKWLQYMSYIYYSSAISLKSFIGDSGLTYDCSTADNPNCEISGTDMLKDYGIVLSTWDNFAICVGFWAVLNVAALFTFRYYKFYNPVK